jgi:hypothetical protein
MGELSKQPVSLITGISWEDFASIQVQERGWRDPRTIPAWSQDDDKCRAVILVKLRHSIKGTGIPRDKIHQLQDVRLLDALAITARRQRVARGENLSGFQRELIESQRSRLQVSVAGRLCRILWLAYRLHFSCVEIAEELGDTTPVHVRQTLWKLNQVARRLFPAEDCQVQRKNHDAAVCAAT